MFTQIFLSGNKKSQLTGAFQTSLTPTATCVALSVWSEARCNNRAKQTNKKTTLMKPSMSQLDCCRGLEGCGDRFGAWNDCLLSGTPSQAFPTSLGPRGRGARAEARGGLLAPQQSSGLWLGKATAHCSHHLPL